AANNTATSAAVDVTIGSSATPTTLGAVHDAFVRQGAPTTVFNGSTIFVKNSDPGGANGSFYRAGYLRFDASSLTDPIASGTLTLTVTTTGQGVDSVIEHSLHLVADNTWNE